MTDASTQHEISAIIFDMGRVLVNIDNALLVEKLFTNLDAEDLQTLGRKTMSDPAMIEFNTGRIKADEFHRRMCEKYQIDADFEAFKILWCEIFYTMDGMEELVGKVSNKVVIGLLSDTDPVHWEHIRTTWPWINQIKNPTLSYEIGVMKPNPAIYLAATENVGTPPEHCLFVDDLQDNVDGAQAVGMQGIRFENATRLSRYFKDLCLLEIRY